MDSSGESLNPPKAVKAAGPSTGPLARPSDAWFRSVVEAANEGIWIIDLEARTIFANERMASILRTKPADLIGRTPFEFLSQEDQLSGADVMARNFDGLPVEFEITFRLDDGTSIPVLAGSAPLRDEAGAIVGSVATFIDLTARKAAEEAIELRNAEFQALADNMPALCWMAYGDGHIYWYNRRWYEYTGTSPEGQEGWGWESVHDPEVLPAVMEQWKHSIETGEPFEMTFPLRGSDGVFRPFLTRVVPVRGEDGTISRWFGSNTDVDALHQAQEELRASREQLAKQVAELEALYGSAPIGLGFFDRECRYLKVNEELAAINGVPVEAHIGRSVRDVLGDYSEIIQPIIERVFETGTAIGGVEASGESPGLTGVQRHWLAGFFPIRGSAGNVDSVGAWVIEISDRKAAEQRELLLAREVDHRAKNLLAVVQSVVQLTRAETADELKESVIGRIQSLARAHALLAESRWEGVDLSELVREEMEPFSGSQARFDGPPIRLRPAAAQSLALVLHELATNAAKYGALSQDGSLDIGWTVEGNPKRLLLDWIESGTSIAGAPTRVGFGSRIIIASVERQLRGRLTQDWRADGLHCRLEFPLEAAASEA